MVAGTVVVAGIGMVGMVVEVDLLVGMVVEVGLVQRVLGRVVAGKLVVVGLVGHMVVDYIRLVADCIQLIAVVAVVDIVAVVVAVDNQHYHHWHSHYQQ